MAFMNILVTNMNNVGEKKRTKISNSSMFRFCLAQLKMYTYVMLMMRTTNPIVIHWSNEDRHGRSQWRKKKKEKETSTYTTIEKERYICALTNLPRTTHTTLWRRVKHILFFISPLFSFAFFFAENVIRIVGRSFAFVNK